MRTRPGTWSGAGREGRRAGVAGTLVVALVLAVALLGCGPRPTVESHGAPATRAPAPPPVVALVGDSLMVDDVDLWRASSLAARASLEIWAVAGAGYEHLPVGPDGWLAGLDPRADVVVVALGANNANSPFDQEGWTARDELLLHGIVADAREAGGARRIVLVTVGPAPDAPVEYRFALGRHNRFVRALAALDPDLFVLADVAAAASGRPGLHRDVIHHSPVGAGLYRATITAAIERASTP